MATLRSNYSASPIGTRDASPYSSRTNGIADNHYTGGGGPIEANQIVDILRKRIVYLSGGRDVRGGPVLTFPALPDDVDFTTEDIVSTVSYLASIPSDEARQKGFVVLVDNRKLDWKNQKLLLRILQETLPDEIHAIYIVGGSDRRLTLSFRKDRSTTIEPHTVTIQKLHSHISPSELTYDFEGHLSYSHDTWLKQRMQFEKFVREGRITSHSLDNLFLQVTNRLRQDESLNPMDLLREHRRFIEAELDVPQRIIREGRELYSDMKSDVESGFPEKDESKYTLDQVVTMNQIKRLVEELENKLEKIQELWQEKERELGVKGKITELELAMKTVVDWILGPGEKLLVSHKGIGRNYPEADDLRKHHEQLELKCTDTYGTYAELRHRVEEVLVEGHDRPQDLEAQRNYMDTVCRSFASRLERRRNLVISSVKFHRLAEELYRMLDELLQIVCTEITAHDVPTAEQALKELTKKKKVPTATLR